MSPGFLCLNAGKPQHRPQQCPAGEGGEEWSVKSRLLLKIIRSSWQPCSCIFAKCSVIQPLSIFRPARPSLWIIFSEHFYISCQFPVRTHHRVSRLRRAAHADEQPPSPALLLTFPFTRVTPLSCCSLQCLIEAAACGQTNITFTFSFLNRGVRRGIAVNDLPFLFFFFFF